jgi:hypothetical protein
MSLRRSQQGAAMFRNLLVAVAALTAGPLQAETLDDLVDRSTGHAPTASAPRVLDMVSSVTGSEYNFSRSADGRVQVFARSDAGFARSKIFIAERTGRGMSAARPIGFSDPRWRDSDPWLTPDGSTLYFVSDRPTAARPDKTDLDIWRSRRTAAGWSAPEHLGDAVNGLGEELGPEVHAGRLYFAAARRSGRGGLDIYAAPASGESFGTPELLPEPLNSAGSESDFTLSSDGRTALFWRMVGGRGVLHRARRTDDGWAAPEPLPPAFNPGGCNFTPAFGADGRTVTFASAPTGAGLADVYEGELM